MLLDEQREREIERRNDAEWNKSWRIRKEKGIKPCTVVRVKIFIILQNTEENAAACVMQKARLDNCKDATWP